MPIAAIRSDIGERYDNPPRGGLLSKVEKLVNEPLLTHCSRSPLSQVQMKLVDIVNLNGGTNDAVVKDITTANSVPEDFEKAQFDDDWQEGWVMLTGIDFPSTGCWEITGEYFGQSLTFVVETVDHSTVRTNSE